MSTSKPGYFRYWYFRMRYRKWFENHDGIKGYAEQAMSWLIADVIKKSSKLLEDTQQLSERRDQLVSCEQKLLTLPLLDNDVYFTIHKKIVFTKIIIPILIGAEVFLNYVSTLIFITGEGLLFALLRWVTAIGLTAIAIVGADLLLDAISPVKAEQPPIEIAEHTRNKRFIRIFWSSTVLIAIEFAIAAIAERRARDVEGNMAEGLLYYGFIVLAVVFPLVVAYLRWERNHYYDAYRNRHELNKVQEDLKVIEEQISVNKLQEHLNLKNQVNEEWSLLSEFRVYKENYNLKKGIENENLSKHFAKDKKSFSKEAKQQYVEGLRSDQPNHHHTSLPANYSTGRKKIL